MLLYLRELHLKSKAFLLQIMHESYNMIKTNSHLLGIEAKLIFTFFVLLLIEIYSDLLYILLFVVWMLIFFL